MTTTNEANPPPEVNIPDANEGAEDPQVDDGSLTPPASNEPGPFALEVDPQQQYKAKELKLCSLARPHMRAFHVSSFVSS